MKRMLAAAALAFGLGVCGPSAAQDNSAHFLQAPISDATVDSVMNGVMRALPHARGPNGPLPPLTDAERAHLLDRDLVREVIDIGAASGVGQACGLDWQRNNFLPMMARERARGDRSDHQLAAIAIAHGLIQQQIASAGQCGDSGAAAVNDFYHRKWGVATTLTAPTP